MAQVASPARSWRKATSKERLITQVLGTIVLRVAVHLASGWLHAESPHPIRDLLPDSIVAVEHAERRRIAEALAHAGGSRTLASKALGVPRTTFINRLRRYGLGWHVRADRTR